MKPATKGNTKMIDFSDLETDVNADGTFAPSVKTTNPKYARKTFTCEGCNGTGIWNSGRANRYGNAKCNTCHGTGQMVTSADDRRAKRAKAAAKKGELVKTAQADNEIAVGGRERVATLRAAADWSEFAASLMDQHGCGKAWSVKQVAAINGMLDKLDAKKAAKAEAAAKRKADAPSVDLTPIKTMFDAAVAAGRKAPQYRAEGLVLSRAKDHSANPNALYVKNESGEYLGKITPDMKFQGLRGTEGVLNSLLNIAANPAEAAVRYGRETGACACCGRELTNSDSIKLGIGPICKENWGF